MNHNLMNVEALWPRLDRAYKFDAGQNRSMPTEATDPDGKYELNVIVTEAQAKELAKKMTEAFSAKSDKDWPAWKPTGLGDLFKQDESGCWIVKMNKKTYGEAKSKPKQFDKDGQLCADDFQLTTGSKIHVMVGIRPWKFGGKSGVTLRPEKVKWIELKEREEADPFGDSEDPFGLPSTESKASDAFDDEIPF